MENATVSGSPYALTSCRRTISYRGWSLHKWKRRFGPLPKAKGTSLQTGATFFIVDVGGRCTIRQEKGRKQNAWQRGPGVAWSCVPDLRLGYAHRHAVHKTVKIQNPDPYADYFLHMLTDDEIPCNSRRRSSRKYPRMPRSTAKHPQKVAVPAARQKEKVTTMQLASSPQCRFAYFIFIVFCTALRCACPDRTSGKPLQAQATRECL